MVRDTHQGQGVMSRLRPLVAALLVLATAWLYSGAFAASASTEGLADRLEDALFDPQSTSPLFALGVFLFILYLRRARLLAALGQAQNRGLGVGSLIVAVVLLLWSDAIGAPDLARLSFVLWVVAGGFWLGGLGLVRMLALPLLAIVLSLPLPLALTNQLLLPLQLATGELASGMLSLIGQSHSLHGDQIFKANLIFQVIEGCSGYRSIFSLALASVLYAELVCRGPAEKCLLIALSPLVAFFMNGVRVVVLIMREVPSDAPEHAIQGVLMMVLGVVVLAAIEAIAFSRIFARSRARTTADGATTDDEHSSSADPIIDRGLVTLLSVAVVSSILIAQPGRIFATTPPDDRLNIESIGADFDPWSVRPLRTDGDFLGTTRFRHMTYRAFTRRDETVRLFLAAEDRRARNRFGWSPKTAIPGSAWDEIEAQPDVRIRDQRLSRSLVHYPARTVLVYHWREGYAGWAEELLRNWLSLDHSKLRIDHSSLVVRLEVDIEKSISGLKRGDAVLHDFAERLHRELEDRAIRRSSNHRDASRSRPPL